MQAAQRLYEGIDIGGETVGLITYMRTDGVQTAPEALDEARTVIGNVYGRDYVPEKARFYSTKAKNAQEAHEAIRPTSLARNPGSLRLEGDLGRLYELIWKRMIASQMESARIERTTIDLDSADGKTGLRASGQVVLFDGYLKVYEEGRDDADDEESGRLPQVTQGDEARALTVRTDQHFTEPPPRYSEASLVKKMEELGIGRPSTYASVLSVLRDRAYVRMEKTRFIPRTRAGSSPCSSRSSSSSTSNTTSPPTWRRSSTWSRRATSTGRSCCASSGRTSIRRPRRSSASAPARCWTIWTARSRPSSIRRRSTGRTPAPAPTAARAA
jgi:DNA topoisomerase-1